MPVTQCQVMPSSRDASICLDACYLNPDCDGVMAVRFANPAATAAFDVIPNIPFKKYHRCQMQRPTTNNPNRVGDCIDGLEGTVFAKHVPAITVADVCEMKSVNGRRDCPDNDVPLCNKSKVNILIL